MVPPQVRLGLTDLNDSRSMRNGIGVVHFYIDPVLKGLGYSKILAVQSEGSRDHFLEDL